MVNISNKDAAVALISGHSIAENGDKGPLLAVLVSDTEVVHNAQQTTQLQSTIKKSHVATMSCQEMTAVEQKIVAIMILVRSMRIVKKEDELQQVFNFGSLLLAKMFGCEIKDLYSILRKPCDRLTTRRYASDDGNSSFTFINYFEAALFDKNGLTLRPTNSYLQYLQNDTKGVVLVDPVGYFRLKGDHSVRLYEVLSRFKDKGFSQYPIPLFDLQKIFGVYDDLGKLKKKTYKKASVFFDKVIIPAIREIENNSSTRKKLIFFDGGDGKHGFTYHKESKDNGTVEFHYKWTLGANNTETMLRNDAISTIKRLETKRQNGRLDIDELELLRDSYIQLDEINRAEKISEAIKTRLFEEQSLGLTNEKSLASLDFLTVLDKLNSDPY